MRAVLYGFQQGEHQMKRSIVLTITSLLSILLMTFHLSDDIVRKFEPGGFKNVSGVLMLVVWLFGTLILAGRAIGINHHPSRVDPGNDRPYGPHEGCGTCGR